MSVAKKLKEREARHVRLYHWIMQTEAWQDLDCVARQTYVELASRYAGPGSNNGRIPCSILEIADALHVSKQTAMRALGRLVDHGFIVREKLGSFNTKVRHASEWRLTEFKDDVTGAMATRDFARWKKTERGSISEPGRVSSWNRTGVRREQSPTEPISYGSTSTPGQPIGGSTTTPLLVYQGGAADDEHDAVQKDATQLDKKTNLNRAQRGHLGPGETVIGRSADVAVAQPALGGQAASRHPSAELARDLARARMMRAGRGR